MVEPSDKCGMRRLYSAKGVQKKNNRQENANTGEREDVLGTQWPMNHWQTHCVALGAELCLNDIIVAH